MSKDNKLKVGVRCRPHFNDEVDNITKQFISIVDIDTNNATTVSNEKTYEKLSLTLENGRQREFVYNYVFSPNASQDLVYERIARPIVDEVLQG